MITGINKSKLLISCKFVHEYHANLMEENIIQIKCGLTINVNASVRNTIYAKNSDTYSCENGKYLASIIDNSVIACDETIEETKTIPTNFNEKSAL